MISLNKFFAVICMATISGCIVKAEPPKEQSEFEQYLNKAKDGARKVKNTIMSIDKEEVKEKISLIDTHAQGFFRTYPKQVLAATWFSAGKALTHYNTANNASRYFAIEKDLSTATIAKDTLHQIEKSTQHCKNSFVRYYNKLGKRNMIVSLFLAGGHIYYNHIKKATITDKNQTPSEILEKNKDNLPGQS